MLRRYGRTTPALLKSRCPPQRVTRWEHEHLVELMTPDGAARADDQTSQHVEHLGTIGLMGSISRCDGRNVRTVALYVLAYNIKRMMVSMVRCYAIRMRKYSHCERPKCGWAPPRPRH